MTTRYAPQDSASSRGAAGWFQLARFSDLLPGSKAGRTLGLILLALFAVIGLARGAKVIDFFQISVGLTALFFLLFRRGALTGGDAGLGMGLFAFCAWYVAATLKLDEAAVLFPVALLDAAHSLLFFCALVVVFSAVASARQFMFAAFVIFVAGVLIALSSLFSFYGTGEHALNARLRPLGEAQHPIIGMYYYILPFVFGLIWAGQVRGRGLWFVLAGLLVLVAVFMFSGSRGPFLAMISSVALHLFLNLQPATRKVVLAALALLAVLVWLFGGFEWLGNRGTSLRPMIWLAAVEQWWLSPWTGHGNSLSNIVLSDGETAWHAHNIWLSTAYWGGALGVLLLLGINLRAALLLWRHRLSLPGKSGLLLLVFGNVALLTDGNLLLQTPGPIWFVFLLPVGIAASLGGRVSALGRAAAGDRANAHPADA